MCARRVPQELPSRGEDEDDLSLVTNDMVLILKGNYAGEVGLFVTRKPKLWSVYTTESE